MLAPAGADKRGPKASFPLVGYAGIQPTIHKRVPARAPDGSRVLLKAPIKKETKKHQASCYDMQIYMW